MKKIFTTLTFVLLFSFLIPNAKAQVGFSIGPHIGYASPTGNYSGTVNDFYDGTKYGLSSGVNIGACAKLNVLFISGRVDIDYCWLKNSGNLTSSNGSAETKQNVFSFGIGPEYSLSLPMSPVKPYASIEILFSSFSGESTFSGVSGVQSSAITLSSATRTGLGLIAGAEFKLAAFSLDLNVRYNMYNVFGKSFNSYSNNDRTNSYSSLNDDNDPNYDGDKHPISSSRSISTVEINLGVLFGL
jgi:opacity protein-like surface antigen